jgi:hypothetical protein
LTDHYPRGSLSQATAVDLGGSKDDTAFAIAHEVSKLTCILQDLPAVIESSHEQASINVRLMAHNFFQPQSIKDGSVYLFRWIFHNWPDKYCISIVLNGLERKIRHESLHHNPYLELGLLTV